jgi:hypothetical protein
MKIKNTFLSIIIVTALTLSSLAQAQNNRLGNLLGILQEISTLADEFNLTAEQKSEMRSVLMGYLPSMALKANAMMANRKNLLKSSLAQDESDEELLENIATKQGQLLASLIISKEHMKKDIRGLLTDDQKEFVDELFATLIQYRLDHRS